jgi:hypothetical protein
MTNDKRNILIIGKKKRNFFFSFTFFDSNEIHTDRNKICQIEIFFFL